MPIHRACLHKDLTIFTVIGEVTYEEAFDILRTFYAEHTTLNVLWDVRQGTMTRLTYARIRKVAEYVGLVADVRSGGKTALVTAKELDYGIGRTLDMLAKIIEAPFSFRVFKDYDEAITWLKSESPL